jgi:hypothetical protein
MTDAEIRIAVAEACGWKVIGQTSEGHIGYYRPSSGIEGSPQEIIPDYLNDLNAMNEAVAALEIGFDGSQADDYQQALWGIVNPGISFHEIETITDVGYLQRFVEATARQRARSFLETLGLYKNDSD